MENAKQYFELTDEEKDTILRHMWPLTPVPPSTRAGYAVTFADKMCCLEETKATVKRTRLYRDIFCLRRRQKGENFKIWIHGKQCWEIRFWSAL